MTRRFRLPWYVLREVLPLYLIGMATLLVLVMIDLFSALAAIILRNQPPAWLVLQTVLDRLPYLLTYTLAPAVAFAVLVGLGRLAKDSELKAAFASGVPPLRLLVPLLLFGLVMSGLSFVISNYWQPFADERFMEDLPRLWYNQTTPRYETAQSYPDPASGNLFHAGQVSATKDPAVASLYGVMVITRKGTYTAQTGTWDSRTKRWELYNVYLSTPSDATGATLPQRFDRKSFSFPVRVLPLQPPAKYLPLADLRRQAVNASLDPRARYDAVFTLNRRFSDPLAAVIMAVIGGALGLTVANRAWGFAWVILLVFVYWVCWTFGANLAGSQAASAAVAAWLPSLVFAAGGAVALRRLA
ncbi:MAG TPA: LptF/LptG family permease [Deinococcales bacterium]|nr:LptF/LptG family permease [Deinococcales bacterium]